MTALRVGLCPDFLEERWPSMERVANRLEAELRNYVGAIAVTSLRPRFARRAARAGREGSVAFSVDRMLNRFWDYPRHVGRHTGECDVFHIVDHSYAHLVHRLPADRTIVTCHDLDAFRSILEPGAEPRSRAFRAMAGHVLSGLRRAARVTCDTAAVRDELLSRAVVDGERLVLVPIGAAVECSPAADPEADGLAARLLEISGGAVELLHVGSTIERKRIDVLLGICAAVRRTIPSVRLVRVGGAFTPEQHRLVRDLGLIDAVSVLGPLDDRTLAAVYRRAALVLQPSDREGFGLPVVEAMACGTPVVASDLPVLREVGGPAVVYCPPGDLDVWETAIVALLDERQQHADRWAARRAACVARGSRFTWGRFAAGVVDVYGDVAAGAEWTAVRRLAYSS